LLALVALDVDAFQCQTDITLGPVTSTEHKGLVIDDSSMRGCPSRIAKFWPNTRDPVKSVRLFKVWDPKWPETDRLTVWTQLQTFAESQGVRFMVGTQITCEQERDAQDWIWAREFLELLGPERILGVAIGNELDLLWTKDDVDETVTPECLASLWEGGRFWDEFESRTRDLRAIGFDDVPVTTVFSGMALVQDGLPFREVPGQALVNSFLRNATGATFSNPFVFTFNFYPYFDPNFYPDAGVSDRCSKSLQQATCWRSASGCSVPDSVSKVRQRIAWLLNDGSHRTLWLGETGWSYPRASTLGTSMAGCSAWSSMDAFKTNYAGFLDWDMSSGSYDAPDHAFYFSARDSLNYGIGEHFGMISTCMDSRCKLRSEDFVFKGAPVEGRRVFWLNKVWLAIGASVLGLAVTGSAAVGFCYALPAGQS